MKRSKAQAANPAHRHQAGADHRYAGTPDGSTIEEIIAATGWQSHTVRGAISGALKKKLGLEVTSEKVENRGRVYKLPAA